MASLSETASGNRDSRAVFVELGRAVVTGSDGDRGAVQLDSRARFGRWIVFG
jgi:hypothetical protein